MDFFTISTVVKIVFSIVLVLTVVALSSLAERKVSAYIQDRIGPNRVGIPLTIFGAKKDIPFFGLVQPMADGLKFILKEDFSQPTSRNSISGWLRRLRWCRLCLRSALSHLRPP
jgi:NADH-quinone oxidoreductase subunit H